MQENGNPEDTSFDSEARHFGPWAWIAGLALGGVLIALLFGLADGIGG